MNIWGTVKIMVPFLGPYYNTGPNTGPNLGDPKRDHNFDSSPYSNREKEELAQHATRQPLPLALAASRLRWMVS